mmetsp:Transcript_16332/g.31872  ORF Transcript_16332/g.31872 Transcript_16332/m.31872 type:complete len:203 (+) Transcript_16332:86-694(+)
MKHVTISTAISISIIASILITTPSISFAFSTTPNNKDANKTPSSPDQSSPKFSKPPPLPNSQNPHTILGFDPLSPPTDFRLIHSAYKTLAKRYHPDVAVGPDAPSHERQLANVEFARINQAYETLKRRKDEQVLEMTVMVNGKKYTQKVTTSEEIRKNDPNRIRYEMILENRKRHSPVRSWSDQKYDYEPRHNGDFGPRRLR